MSENEAGPGKSGDLEDMALQLEEWASLNEGVSFGDPEIVALCHAVAAALRDPETDEATLEEAVSVAHAVLRQRDELAESPEPVDGEDAESAPSPLPLSGRRRLTVGGTADSRPEADGGGTSMSEAVDTEEEAGGEEAFEEAPASPPSLENAPSIAPETADEQDSIIEEAEPGTASLPVPASDEAEDARETIGEDAPEPDEPEEVAPATAEPAPARAEPEAVREEPVFTPRADEAAGFAPPASVESRPAMVGWLEALPPLHEDAFPAEEDSPSEGSAAQPPAQTPSLPAPEDRHGIERRRGDRRRPASEEETMTQAPAPPPPLAAPPAPATDAARPSLDDEIARLCQLLDQAASGGRRPPPSSEPPPPPSAAWQATPDEWEDEDDLPPPPVRRFLTPPATLTAEPVLPPLPPLVPRLKPVGAELQEWLLGSRIFQMANAARSAAAS